jgi:hypothetical protein
MWTKQGKKKRENPKELAKIERLQAEPNQNSIFNFPAGPAEKSLRFFSSLGMWTKRLSAFYSNTLKSCPMNKSGRRKQRVRKTPLLLPPLAR